MSINPSSKPGEFSGEVVIGSDQGGGTITFAFNKNDVIIRHFPYRGEVEDVLSFQPRDPKALFAHLIGA